MQMRVMVIGIDPASKKETKIVGIKADQHIVVRGQRCSNLLGCLVSTNGTVLKNYRVELFPDGEKK